MAGKSPDKRTGFVSGDVFSRHRTAPGHPERAERLAAIEERIKAKTREDLFLIEPAEAPLKWISEIHERPYIEELKAACSRGAHVFHSADNSLSPDTLNAALHAAGGVLNAVDRVVEGRIKNAFCAVRPPGHHALKDRAMGFCFFNNVAVAARYLQRKHSLRKVAIIDWDVHHGNGTQDAFYSDASVMYVSLHQHPHFPGTGHPDERGAGEGEGTTLNLPVDPGSGDSRFLSLFEDEIKPAVRDFNPDFILISAGFDAHMNDPLSAMQLTAPCFGRMTEQVKDLAKVCCEGRIVSVLEGGYDLKALAESVLYHVHALST